eukprot:TRINITY_DN11605_c2_g1_i1.p2 TRINITY_DN11605_c2_g1~~TRINITY_DN11605_c2_g1_i1.p2  ORF type:complete len:302 (+),score=25.84 TRINITY_DN11605_c2_g1_i1:2395-3300(+)
MLRCLAAARAQYTPKSSVCTLLRRSAYLPRIGPSPFTQRWLTQSCQRHARHSIRHHRPHAPAKHPEPVIVTSPLLKAIIAVNTGIFVLWMNPNNHEWMLENFACDIRNLDQGRWWTVLSCGFSHILPPHFLINMFVLFQFARPVNQAIGSPAFAGLYLCSVVAASLAHLKNNMDRQHRYDFLNAATTDRKSLGASGGVLGTCVFYAMMYPFRPIYVFMVVPIPSIVAIGAFVAYDVTRSSQDAMGDMTDHAGHVGGALAGLLFYGAFLALRGNPKQLLAAAQQTWRQTRCVTRRMTRRDNG